MTCVSMESQFLCSFSATMQPSSPPPGSFVSVTNVQYLFQLCKEFLQDKFQLKVSEPQLQSMLQSSMQELILYFRNHPPMPSLDELNKRAIIRVKDKALQGVSPPQRPTKPSRPRSSKPPVEEEEEPIASPSPALTDPLPPPVMESKRPTDPNVAEDGDDFVKRLQQLELQRSANLVVAENPSSKALQPPAPPVLQAPAAAPAPPSAPTVLYVPTVQSPSKMSRTIVVSSLDRMWDYFHDRHTFPWNGPTPDSSTIAVARLLLPSRVSRQTPLVEVRVTGAGGQTIDIHCTCVAQGPVWDTWQPVATHATLRNIACPWNIQLRDISQQPLELGKDGIQVRGAELLPRGTTKLQLSDQEGIHKDTLLVCKAPGGEVTRHHVLQVSDLGVEIAGARVSSFHEDVLCAVWNMQSTVVLEVTKNEAGQG